VDGTVGQVLSTNGSGTFSFIDVGLSSLGISDGTAGQVLSTNGSGTLSFIDRDAVGGPTGISLALAIAVG
jgi:hypothetical protein